MPNGAFKFENCLLKHFVRKEGWLPECRNRAKQVKAGRVAQDRPRLKYFTFCAVGAIDVVMLDLEKVIRRSPEEHFDTVYFFDVDEAYVARTRESIPGAIGFPEDFVKVVLLDDPEEANVVDTVETLEPPRAAENTKAVREKARLLAMRRDFIRAYPFDIINLDLERYLFIPREQLPGKMVNAIRKVFEWQRRSGEFMDGKATKSYKIDGFSLMFTLRVGPTELGEDYKAMMQGYVTQNLAADAALQPLFEAVSGGRSANDFLGADFNGFFKLAAPKTILAVLKEADWHVVGGVKVFEFERATAGGEPYQMLHLVMDVRRNNPPLEQRAPGVFPPEAAAAYASCVRALFEGEVVRVEPIAKANESDLSEHLGRIVEHRRRVGSG